MALPLSTSTVSVQRNSTEAGSDPYDSAASWTTVFSGVRAVVSTPTASEQLVGGQRVAYDASLRCDPIALQPGDRVTDSATSITWTVLNVEQVNALGQSFTLAQMRSISGAT